MVVEPLNDEQTCLSENYWTDREEKRDDCSGSLHEECGIFGVFGHQNANQLVYFGLHALQHRGQEGAGITTSNENGDFYHYKGNGLLAQVFKDPAKLNGLKGNRGIGHVRYSTSGSSSSVTNVQPFLFHFHDQTISLAHNGNLTNARSLRKKLEENGSVFHSDSDSEVLVHLIRTSHRPSFHERLEEALNQIRGGFNFLILTDEELIGVVDPNSFRPLAVGQLANGAYVLSSETCAFHAMGAKFVRNVHAGNYVVINKDGLTIHQYTDKTQIALESMEFIYFARPDSDIAGINVHSARKNLGRVLAKERPCKQADMVIGVPNSSLSAATGYAEESGLPYELGLIKNQYIQRTFIQPTQELREQGVKRKLSAVKGVVEGKSIVLVDDSIVRGTTSKRLIKLLKEAGAREIHLRISSPPLRFPNFYGIDLSTSSELMAANHTVDEMCQILGCDSLGFMTVEGLIEGIGLHFDAPHRGLCTDVFTGDYPAPLCDYEERLKGQLTPLQKRVLKGENVDD
ncbi:amidophosphoribosyltransferase [Atopobacter sp. AH10]|uniref:amidophosphoribosyltransferase n=1 Tax=Atopobacter sp. AH10 TaxID=2315861 RepID=UPI000EF21397|nr:amidophosphoribosyltransferase [Atopobacter sp. AH10]RLK64000.1 amidophosphoribosyltransferase [Atopobacter sp. AH10]